MPDKPDPVADRRRIADALTKYEVTTGWPSQRAELLDWIVEYGNTRWKQGRTAGKAYAVAAAESSTQWQAKKARERGVPLPKRGERLGAAPRRGTAPGKGSKGNTTTGSVPLPRRRRPPADGS